MKKKLLISGLSLLLVIVVGVGIVLAVMVPKWNQEEDKEFEEKYWTDEVIVVVKEEYKDKYLNEEFTKKDFKLLNVDRIVYSDLYEFTNEMRINVYFKHPGVKQVKKAYKKFESLYFVSEVRYQGRITLV